MVEIFHRRKELLSLKPYNREYVLEKIDEYNKLISPQKIGNYEIKAVDGLKGIIQGYLYEKEGEINKSILELHGPEHVWMRLTPLEIEGSYFAIKRAEGKVGVVGLGLGYTVWEMAKKANVKEVVVYEISKDVIDLYNRNFKENPKIKIIHGDAFEVEKDDFDFFYADIYEYKLTSQVVSDYEKFNRLHNIKEYAFFGMEHFLLSCRYEEIVWVYIPENWMEMSKDAYRALGEEGLLNYYSQIDEELVSSVLARFKPVLEELG